MVAIFDDHCQYVKYVTINQSFVTLFTSKRFTFDLIYKLIKKNKDNE